jgi:hypothetical protein
MLIALICAASITSAPGAGPVVTGSDGFLSRMLSETLTRAGFNLNPPKRFEGRFVRATGAGEAMRWRRLTWLDENGDIQRGALSRALGQRALSVERSSVLRQGRAGLSTAGPSIAVVNWVSRGPDNVAGRARSLLVDPRNTQNMWSGSVSGGIWHSTNGGTTWSVVNDRMTPLSICCMAYDTANFDVMYAGTGEGFFNIDAIGGRGLFKSTDGGANWSVLANTTGWSNVCTIAVSPTNSQVILCGLLWGGIQRSTDGGATWTNPYWAQGGFNIVFHPTDGNKAVASVIDYDFNTGEWFHRALYTTDAGATWTSCTGDLARMLNFDSRITLAYAASSPTTVYASCAANGGKVYRSTDGGQSYTLMTGTDTTGVSWYANPLWVDPTNANTLVTGGVHLYKSTNAGANFTRISDGYMMGDQPHVDMHTLIGNPGFDGVSNRTVYVCNDGGTWKTANIYTASTTSGWTRLDLTEKTTQFYGAAGHGTANLIIGGTQDNGTQRVPTGTNISTLMFGGDGGWCAIDPTNSNYCYGEYVALQIHRSTNGGVSSSYIYSGIGDAGSNANFIAPFILDPNTVTRMLAGGRSLWRSNNVKSTTVTWSSIRAAGTDNISAIAIAPGNSNIVWVGQNDGVVSKTTNGTATTPTWTAIDNNGTANPFPNRYIQRILVDPSNNNVVYVSLGGFSGDNLWKTTNGGTTWTDITGTGVTGLPDAPIRGIARHPKDAYRLYVGTEVGVFQTADGGLTWTTNDFGPANVSTDEVNFMSGSQTLLAATHGRGLWTLDQTLGAASALTINPTQVTGGNSAVGTVTLAAPASTGGAIVTLTDNSTKVTVPATVTVLEGQTTATFTITTTTVTAATTATISAAYAGVTKTATLRVVP